MALVVCELCCWCLQDSPFGANSLGSRVLQFEEENARYILPSDLLGWSWTFEHLNLRRCCFCPRILESHMVQLLFPLWCWLIHLHKMPVLLGLTSAYIRCTLQLYWQQNYQLWWLVRQRMELQNYQCCWVLHWCMMGYTQWCWVLHWRTANVPPSAVGWYIGDEITI